MPKFGNNGKSKVGRAQLVRAGKRKSTARNIGRAMFLDRLKSFPDDKLEKERKKKNV